MLYTGTFVVVFWSSIFILCIPPGIMVFVHLLLDARAHKDRDSAHIKRRIATRHTTFKYIYLFYGLLIVAIAAVVAWKLSNADFAKPFIFPVAFTGTMWMLTDRRQKSSEANDILAKVLSSFTEYGRKTGISGIPLAKEDVPKVWPPFALFLRSFHLEQRVSNPLIMAPFDENRHEDELIDAIQEELDLFVLGLGKREVINGAARIELPSTSDWKTMIFWLAAAADVVFVWPGATSGTIWEMDMCLSEFRRKTIFYAPKLDGYLSTTEEDKRLRNELSFVADVLRAEGYEIPISFEKPTFWIYLDDKTVRSFGTAAESYAYVSGKASDVLPSLTP